MRRREGGRMYGLDDGRRMVGGSADGRARARARVVVEIGNVDRWGGGVVRWWDGEMVCLASDIPAVE